MAILCGPLLAGAMTPAAALAKGHTCVSGDVCLFEKANWAADDPWLDARINPRAPWSAFDGNYANMFKAFPSPHTYNNPDTCNNVHALQPYCNLNDTVTSARNRDSSYKVRLFVHANWSGSYQTLRPLSSDPDVVYNNQTTSLCWIGGSITVANCRS